MKSPLLRPLAVWLLISSVVLQSGAARLPVRSAMQEGGQAEVQLLVIRATDKNDKVDPELREIADMLKKQYRLTGFKLESKVVKSVGLNTAVTATHKNYTASVTPTKREERKVELVVSVTRREGDKDRTLIDKSKTHSTQGKLALYGGFRDGDDTLIIAAGAK
ncbi:MAG: hypothetical protein HRU75_12715 [Planctomycetia bacterium]|nr:MAG: hypothetical protein HRU75_12715 [Planctomycetia bacterium]